MYSTPMDQAGRRDGAAPTARRMRCMLPVMPLQRARVPPQPRCHSARQQQPTQQQQATQQQQQQQPQLRGDQQPQQRRASVHAPHQRRAALAAALAALAAAAAPPPPARAAGGGNAAVLEDLRRMNKEKRLYGLEDPGTALSQRLEAVQAQLQRCELLVKIGQYDNARMQLREGAFKTLRMDLGYGQEMYRLVSQTMARDVVEGVEKLDAALRRRDPPEAVAPMIAALQARVKDVGEAVERMADIK
ncbi:MAG: hypothetical protein J3K34DRAFT_47535 [Monoraphidium minutum]|nr:MAG: hypothetical protein J3K34DRAFT_47535 [Monoraphidium minutum]